MDIDGFTQANVGMPYNYPNQVNSGATPTEITTVPNTTAAIDRQQRAGPRDHRRQRFGGGTGFVLDTSDAMLRGLIIDGFGVGVEVPNADDVGDSDPGRFHRGVSRCIRSTRTRAYHFRRPTTRQIVGAGNAQQGVIIDGANTTLGGASTQDDNVIAGNGAQGV